MEISEGTTADVSTGGGMPASLMFGIEGVSAEPSVTTAEPATDAGAEPQEPHAADAGQPQPSTGSTPAQPQAAQAQEPAPDAGGAQAPQAADVDPELSESDNALVQSVAEAERPALTDKVKAASFWRQLNDAEKPIGDVASYFEQKNPTRYGEMETAIVSKVAADPARIARLAQSNPEAYGKFAAEAFRNDPDFFLRQGTGRQDLTFEQVKAALDGGGSGIPGAEALTDEELEDLREWDSSVAGKLEAAREAAKNAPAQQAKSGEGQEPAQNQAALPPEKVIERYETVRRTESETFEHGVTPVTSYVERKAGEVLGAEPTAQERELTPEVATLKELKREIFMKGFGKDLPSFRDGLAQWGQHRKLGGREFDSTLQRLGKFATDGKRDGAAEAGRELIPFADAYFNERLAHPVMKHIDTLIALAAGAANPPVRAGAAVPGGQNSQPASSTSASGDAYLLQHAVEHAK